MPDVWYNKEDVVKIDQELISKVKRRASSSPKKRARFCLHKDDKARVQEMVIAVSKGAYLRPHRHTFKSESFHVIEGRYWLFIFDNDGKVIERFKMGTKSKGDIFLYRCEPKVWHTIIPLTPYVVFHEVTRGPFVRTQATLFAPWAPPETNKKAGGDFQKKLLKMCR